MHGTSLCPSPAAVRATLVDLIPRGQEHVFEHGVDVALSARGRRYRVVVRTPEKQAEKSYADDHEDCEKRTRVAAVFVFLTVMPPEVWADALEEEGETALTGESESAVVTSAAAEPTDATDSAFDSASDSGSETFSEGAARRRSALVRLELGAVLQVAPALGGSVASRGVGGELRAVLGAGPVAGQLVVGYVPPSQLVHRELLARSTRVPAGTGVRWNVPLADWSLGIDVLVYGELQRIESTGLLQANDQSLVRWGTRGGFTLSARNWRSFPFASLHATFLPDRRELVLLPRGPVGELPRVWLGATVGFALGL